MIGARVPVRLAAALLLAVGAAQAARAAGPHDGAWRGTMLTEFGNCPLQREVEVTIVEGAITGRIGDGRYRLEVVSQVDERGRVARDFARGTTTLVKIGSGYFDRGQAELTWTGLAETSATNEEKSGCEGRITLQRGPP